MYQLTPTLHVNLAHVTTVSKVVMNAAINSASYKVWILGQEKPVECKFSTGMEAEKSHVALLKASEARGK